MKNYIFIFFFTASSLAAELFVGVATEDITPPIGTPSAGYEKRKSAPMQGVHDPLLASAMVLDNGVKKIVFCSVDHLGLPFTLNERVKQAVKRQAPQLEGCSFYIGSSHTHSGGGAFYDIPVVGELLAGPYVETIAQGYVDGVAQAIIKASERMQPAKIGIGYSKVHSISDYRSKWPEHFTLENDLAVIKVTSLDNELIAVLFNFALHPTVLGPENRLFSADFVGYARNEIRKQLGANVTCLYFNGAQAEITPPSPQTGSFCHANKIGTTLANAVTTLCQTITTDETISIKSSTKEYSFAPQSTPYGLKVPLESYPTELSLLVLNSNHAFAAIPGELSCLLASQLKTEAAKLGLAHLSILGLVNDAHGYIIMPEAYHAKTMESGLSFGGEMYGTRVHDLIFDLIYTHAQ